MKHSNRAIIESHQEPSALTSIAARYNVDWTISKVPWVWWVTKPYLNIVGSDWMGQGLDPATPHVPYTHQSLCTSYYTDDSNNTQGPSSSATMLEWQMVCYFVLGLRILLQREEANIQHHLQPFNLKTVNFIVFNIFITFIIGIITSLKLIINNILILLKMINIFTQFTSSNFWKQLAEPQHQPQRESPLWGLSLQL